MEFLRAWVREVGIELRCCAPAWALTWERVGPLPSISCFYLCGQLYNLIVLLNYPFHDEVLCWKPSPVNALVDSGAFMHQAPALSRDFTGCPNLAGTGMWQLRLPGCREGGCKDIYKEMSPSSVFPNTTKYSCLAQIILKMNHLQWFCFVQYCSLKPPLHAHTGTHTHPLQDFCWEPHQLKSIRATAAVHIIKHVWVIAVSQITLISWVTAADFVHSLGFFLQWQA